MILTYQNETVQISGIAANPPPNSHFHFNMLLSMDSWEFAKKSGWTTSTWYTYVKLYPAADLNLLQSKLDYFVERYAGAEIEKQGMTMKQLREKGFDFGFIAQPMLEIHLRSNMQDEFEPNGNVTYLFLFGAISLIIIGMACINFMNLSTARSASRAKEVGVRKTIGALRLNLMRQFIMESSIYTLISVLLALLVMYGVMGPFNILAGKQLHFSMLADPVLAAGIVLFTVLIGLLAGSYPAFYLTSFRPIDVLKGKLRTGMKSNGVRNIMVITQFTISIGLIICALVIYGQLRYVQEKDLGFEKENVMNVSHALDLDQAGAAFRNELLKHPEFVSLSYSSALPPNVYGSNILHMEGSDRDITLSVYEMDYDHLKTMGYTMAKGRFFSREFPSDSSAIILNAAAAAQMGIVDIEGQRILSPGYDGHLDSKLIGIMKNFNFESLRNTIKPMAILLGHEPNNEIALRLTPGNIGEKVKRVEEVWKKFAPQSPFEYSFLNQNFDAVFQAERHLSRVILTFTFLAIGIGCLGLFGLTTFAAEQRAKEISIRKVMGATVSQVVFLLSKDISKLVMIAFVVAIPISVYLMDQWLQEFAYRVSVGRMVVLLAGAIA